MNANLKTITEKMNIKNKSKLTKRSISQNGKKELTLPPKSIPKLCQRLKFKTESQKQTKFSNGSQSPFMENPIVNFIGRILEIKFSLEMKGKISDKGWEKSTPAVPDKSKELRLKILSKDTAKLQHVTN